MGGIRLIRAEAGQGVRQGCYGWLAMLVVCGLLAGCGASADSSPDQLRPTGVPQGPVATLSWDRSPSGAPVAEGRGGADSGGPSVAPSATPAPVSEPLASSTTRGDCDPNYTGACVPISASDLDCADVLAMVRVVGEDIHELDDDFDGFGCDTYG